MAVSGVVGGLSGSAGPGKACGNGLEPNDCFLFSTSTIGLSCVAARFLTAGLLRSNDRETGVVFGVVGNCRVGNACVCLESKSHFCSSASSLDGIRLSSTDDAGADFQRANCAGIPKAASWVAGIVVDRKRGVLNDTGDSNGDPGEDAVGETCPSGISSVSTRIGYRSLKMGNEIWSLETLRRVCQSTN